MQQTNKATETATACTLLAKSGEKDKRRNRRDSVFVLTPAERKALDGYDPSKSFRVQAAGSGITGNTLARLIERAREKMRVIRGDDRTPNKMTTLAKARKSRTKRTAPLNIQGIK